MGEPNEIRKLLSYIKGSVETLHKYNDQWLDIAKSLRTEIARLQSENARLTAALNRIANHSDLAAMRQIAQRAVDKPEPVEESK